MDGAAGVSEIDTKVTVLPPPPVDVLELPPQPASKPTASSNTDSNAFFIPAPTP